MAKEKKIVCKICKEEKEGLKKRRYPLFFNHWYCDDCYNNNINSAFKESAIFLGIVFAVIAIALILDFSYFIPESDFEAPIASLLSWAILSVVLWNVPLFSGIQNFLSEGMFWNSFFNALDEHHDNILTLSIWLGLKLIVLIIRMALFIIVILFVLIRFINTLLIKKKVNEAIRLSVLGILSILFLIVAFVIIALLFGANF